MMANRGGPHCCPNPVVWQLFKKSGKNLKSTRAKRLAVQKTKGWCLKIVAANVKKKKLR
jgi:hypothetical protein